MTDPLTPSESPLERLFREMWEASHDGGDFESTKWAKWLRAALASTSQEIWGVFTPENGRLIVAYPRKLQAEVYVSGASALGKFIIKPMAASTPPQTTEPLVSELHALQLAACDVAALSNTRDTYAKAEITRDHPAWTPAYDSVRKTVLREIEYREQLAARATSAPEEPR